MMNQFRERDDSNVDSATEELAERVIGAAIEVHRGLGPGLIESAYQKGLSHELRIRGIEHALEAPFSITYKGVVVGQGRLDLLVTNRLIVEVKSVETLGPIHTAQALCYLKGFKLQLALLINFNISVLKNGIRRVINTRT